MGNATDPTIGGVILTIKQSCLGGVSRAIMHGAMKQNSKTTRRMISVFAQIVQRLPGHLIESIACRHRIKAREFSYSSQLYTLMLGQFLHAFSLNELVDISEVHRAELSRIRGISPAKRNTFSNANRTRDPVVAERFYWALRDRFGSSAPGFRNVSNRGALARFKTRGIYAIDSSVIPLSLNCIDWAKYIHRKSAAKLHMRTNVANMLPDFVIVDSAHRHDSTKALALTEGLKAGDVVIGDRGYFDFNWFREMDEIGVHFVSREKISLRCKVVESVPSDDLGDGIVSDEIVSLTDFHTRKKYAKTFRRIRAIVEVDGLSREMVFVTNNFTWSARTIADLYKSRWTIELLFKELKQTLQLQSFYGTNENAVKWQIWAALIVHLILRYLSFLSKWRGSYSRFVGIVRTAIWLKKDLDKLLRFYGTAPPVVSTASARNIPYLPGFEKAYLRAMGQQTA